VPSPVSGVVLPESSQAPIKRFAIPAVPVTEEIPRWIPIPGTGVHDLLGRPVGGGMSSHPHLQDLPSLVVHHEEDVQRPENTVRTPKKSHAQIFLAWSANNFRQVGDGTPS
jgi:hypothetical protein